MAVVKLHTVRNWLLVWCVALPGCRRLPICRSYESFIKLSTNQYADAEPNAQAVPVN